mmetsp:Transcript_106686/g.299758  ORF Transcript_106686/g.299758 Transcript_106686/m.299758 type:complete len:264 (-) Transcript_106686:1971-2762(-)
MSSVPPPLSACLTVSSAVVSAPAMQQQLQKFSSTRRKALGRPAPSGRKVPSTLSVGHPLKSNLSSCSAGGNPATRACTLLSLSAKQPPKPSDIFRIERDSDAATATKPSSVSATHLPKLRRRSSKAKGDSAAASAASPSSESALQPSKLAERQSNERGKAAPNAHAHRSLSATQLSTRSVSSFICEGMAATRASTPQSLIASQLLKSRLKLLSAAGNALPKAPKTSSERAWPQRPQPRTSSTSPLGRAAAMPRKLRLVRPLQQ